MKTLLNALLFALALSFPVLLGLAFADWITDFDTLTRLVAALGAK